MSLLLGLDGVEFATTTMFLLTREDVEITSVQHPKKAKKVPILSYQGKTFRLLSVFNTNQHTEAHAYMRDLTANEGKSCVLLEESSRFSVWRQVSIDIGLLHPTAPVAYAKACVVMVQTLYEDVEQLLGNKQAKKFGAALELDASKQIELIGGLGGLLRIDPLVETLPKWQEEDMSALLLALHRLGTQFFGRSNFVDRTLLALEELPDNDKTVFMNWLRLSLLSNLWLA